MKTQFHVITDSTGSVRVVVGCVFIKVATFVALGVLNASRYNKSGIISQATGARGGDGGVVASRVKFRLVLFLLFALYRANGVTLHSERCQNARTSFVSLISGCCKFSEDE